MPKLTDTQLVVLSAAAQRADGAIEPLPPNVRGGAAAKIVEGLIRRGLAERVPSGRAGVPDLVRITPEGLAAIGVAEGDEAPRKRQRTAKRAAAGRPKKKRSARRQSEARWGPRRQQAGDGARSAAAAEGRQRGGAADRARLAAAHRSRIHRGCRQEAARARGRVGEDGGPRTRLSHRRQRLIPVAPPQHRRRPEAGGDLVPAQRTSDGRRAGGTGASARRPGPGGSSLPPQGDLAERQCCSRQDGRHAGEPLPPLDGDVAVARVDLHGEAGAPRGLGRNERRAAAGKGLVDGIAARAVVERSGGACTRPASACRAPSPRRSRRRAPISQTVVWSRAPCQWPVAPSRTAYQQGSCCQW